MKNIKYLGIILALQLFSNAFANEAENKCQEFKNEIYKELETGDSFTFYRPTKEFNSYGGFTFNTEKLDIADQVGFSKMSTNEKRKFFRNYYYEFNESLEASENLEKLIETYDKNEYSLTNDELEALLFVDNIQSEEEFLIDFSQFQSDLKEIAKLDDAEKLKNQSSSSSGWGAAPTLYKNRFNVFLKSKSPLVHEKLKLVAKKALKVLEEHELHKMSWGTLMDIFDPSTLFFEDLKVSDLSVFNLKELKTNFSKESKCLIQFFSTGEYNAKYKMIYLGKNESGDLELTSEMTGFQEVEFQIKTEEF